MEFGFIGGMLGREIFGPNRLFDCRNLECGKYMGRESENWEGEMEHFNSEMGEFCRMKEEWENVELQYQKIWMPDKTRRWKKCSAAFSISLLRNFQFTGSRYEYFIFRIFTWTRFVAIFHFSACLNNSILYGSNKSFQRKRKIGRPFCQCF